MRYYLIFLFAVLAGCGSTIPTVKPFKMDIQQGNVVTSKMLLQLRPGMTKSQVKFIMGSPLLVDSFHTNRWDYFYQLRQAGKIVEQRRVILDFDKELLIKVRGDVVPEGTAGAATGNESSTAKTITVEPKPKQEKSWADRLKFWNKDEPTKGVDKLPATPEKIDAPAANNSAPAADAPLENVPILDAPSVLAVPIGGVLAPDAPAAEMPSVEMPALETPVIKAPMIETAPIEKENTIPLPKAETPAIEAPVIETPVIEAPKVELTAPKPPAVPMPAAKEGERLIFRMDRNLNLIHLQAKAEAALADELADVQNSVKAISNKPKNAKPLLPTEEAPGYLERMLEKIGF